MSAASEITRKAKSNLAFALKILPRERREDMVIFYAFCRTMDDLADDPSLPQDQRLAALNAWEKGIRDGFTAPDEFQRDVVSLRDRQKIPNDLLAAIIDGCRMDLSPQRFATWEDLSEYIWKVACAVGLVSIRLFGCQDPVSERYAVALGHALQLTNIMRDVGEDYVNGARIYLPLEEMARFDYSEHDIANHVHDQRLVQMMEFQAARAQEFYREADASIATVDRRALMPARIMSKIYQLLLNDMRCGNFQVYEKRYRISKFQKFAVLIEHLIARSSTLE